MSNRNMKGLGAIASGSFIFAYQHRERSTCNVVKWLDARTGSKKCSRGEELGELCIKIHKAERLIKIGADSNKVMEKLLDDAEKIVFTEE